MSEGPIIFELSEEDRLNNHIPESCWQLSRGHRVFVRDTETDELVQVLDCTIEGEDE